MSTNHFNCNYSHPEAKHFATYEEAKAATEKAYYEKLTNKN